MSNFATHEQLIEIAKRISKKVPQGIMLGNTPVGHIEWQMYLQRDYLKLDGTPLANASNDYDELLKFAQDNSLITADTTDKSLFKYDSTTDVLTLPDYIGLVLQGGNTVEEKEAGLPNIKGDISFVPFIGNYSIVASPVFDIALGATSSISSVNYTTTTGQRRNVEINASKSSSIYSDNVNTVQPPAITLIPQIKYIKGTTMYEQIDAVVNYSTTEKVIGTWIDGKPLYQITLTGTIPSGADTNNTNIIIDDLISNIDNGFIINAFIKDPNYNSFNILNEPATTSGMASSRAWISTGQKAIRAKIASDYIGFPIFVTIQYTKTTD